MAEIELRHIKKSYGETAVVKGVSLNIRDGEFLTLVGPSGCGKVDLAADHRRAGGAGQR